MTFRCYACNQSVSGYARKCPHCLTLILPGGAPSSARSEEEHFGGMLHGIDDEGRSWIFATAFKLAVIFWAVWWGWDYILPVLEGIRDVYRAVKWQIYGVLNWFF